MQNWLLAPAFWSGLWILLRPWTVHSVTVYLMNISKALCLTCVKSFSLGIGDCWYRNRLMTLDRKCSTLLCLEFSSWSIIFLLNTVLIQFVSEERSIYTAVISNMSFCINVEHLAYMQCLVYFQERAGFSNMLMLHNYNELMLIVWGWFCAFHPCCWLMFLDTGHFSLPVELTLCTALFSIIIAITIIGIFHSNKCHVSKPELSAVYQRGRVVVAKGMPCNARMCVAYKFTSKQ